MLAEKLLEIESGSLQTYLLCEHAAQRVAQCFGLELCPTKEALQQNYIPLLYRGQDESEDAYASRLRGCVENRCFPALVKNQEAGSHLTWIVADPSIPFLDNVFVPMVMAPVGVIDFFLNGGWIGSDTVCGLQPPEDKTGLLHWARQVLEKAEAIGATSIELSPFPNGYRIRFLVNEVWQPWVSALSPLLSVFADREIAKCIQMSNDMAQGAMFGIDRIWRQQREQTAFGVALLLERDPVPASSTTLREVGYSDAAIRIFEACNHDTGGLYAVCGTHKGYVRTLLARAERIAETGRRVAFVSRKAFFAPGVLHVSRDRKELPGDELNVLKEHQGFDTVFFDEIDTVQDLRQMVCLAESGCQVWFGGYASNVHSLVARLLSRGVSAVEIADLLRFVCIESLSPMLCGHCRVETEDSRSVRRDTGCEHCGYTGVSGNALVFDVCRPSSMPINDWSDPVKIDHMLDIQQGRGLAISAQSVLDDYIVRGLIDSAKGASECLL